MPRPLSNALARPIAGAALAWLALGLGPASGRALAQFGVGFGWGLFQYRAPSVEAINANANIRASAAFSARAGQRLQDPGDRFAYRQQQIAFQDRYNFESRQSFQTHLGRPANPRGTVVAQANPPASAPGVPSTTPTSGGVPVITSFINAMNQVVWPADSPTAGELGPLRNRSDASTLVVAREFISSGAASLTSVAEARKHLLDYGRPALATVRRDSTPAIADGFHRFLLALYESLAQAGMRDRSPPIPRN